MLMSDLDEVNFECYSLDVIPHPQWDCDGQCT